MQAKGGYERHNGKGERKLNLRRKVLSKVFVSLLRIIKAIGKSLAPLPPVFELQLIGALTLFCMPLPSGLSQLH